MKYVKMLGLLAIVAVTLMAFAGTASATVTEAAGDPVDVGDTFHASSEGANSITGSIAITCQKSTISGKITTNDGTIASGPVESLTFTECGNHTVTTLKAGTISIESAGGNIGNLRSTGAEVTWLWHSVLIGTVHCIYTTNSTAYGTLTGTGHGSNSKTGATLDVTSIATPRLATDGMCGPESFFEASYVFNTPQHLLID